jgi:hypothetical protein
MPETTFELIYDRDEDGNPVSTFYCGGVEQCRCRGHLTVQEILARINKREHLVDNSTIEGGI